MDGFRYQVIGISTSESPLVTISLFSARSSCAIGTFPRVRQARAISASSGGASMWYGFSGSTHAELARQTRTTAERAYYYSAATDRRWGRQYLFKLLRANPSSLGTSVYLLGVCAPRSLTRRLGRGARRVLG